MLQACLKLPPVLEAAQAGLIKEAKPSLYAAVVEEVQLPLFFLAPYIEEIVHLQL